MAGLERNGGGERETSSPSKTTGKGKVRFFVNTDTYNDFTEAYSPALPFELRRGTPVESSSLYYCIKTYLGKEKKKTEQMPLLTVRKYISRKGRLHLSRGSIC